MFVRFRQTPLRLRASIIETRRAAGKVASEHVASLGAIALPMTVPGRQGFWASLWDRLATLSNRIGPDEQASIRNAVHARIPMVLPEEARAEEARVWGEAVALFKGRATTYREWAEREIVQAKGAEGLAAFFADNRAAVLRGEHVEIDPRSLVLEILAAKRGSA